MTQSQSLKTLVTATCVVWTINFIYNYVQDRPVDRVGKKHSIDMSALDLGFAPLGSQLLWILGGFVYVYQKLMDPKSGIEKVFDAHVAQLSIGMGVMNMAFIYVWLMEYMSIAALLMCILAVFSWGLVIHFSMNLVNHKSCLAPGVSKMCIILVQNGVGGLAALAVLAAALDIGIGLVHEFGFKDPVPTVFALGLLVEFMSIGALLDLGDLDKYSRYLITPWLTMSFGLQTMIQNNLSKNLLDSTSLSFLKGTYYYSLVLLVVKLGLSGWRHFKESAQDNNSSNSKSKAK